MDEYLPRFMGVGTGVHGDDQKIRSALDCGERLACQANTTHTLYTARMFCALRISLFPDRLPLLAGGIRIRAYKRDRILCAGSQYQL
jgi:hypothetical protein